MAKIPKCLESSYSLLERTFGRHIPAKYYESVIALMYEGLCDESLIMVVGDFAEGGRDIVDLDYLNIVNHINLEKLKKTPEYNDALRLLETHGYSEWLAEPDIFE